MDLDKWVPTTSRLVNLQFQGPLRITEEIQASEGLYFKEQSAILSEEENLDKPLLWDIEKAEYETITKFSNIYRSYSLIDLLQVKHLEVQIEEKKQLMRLPIDLIITTFEDSKTLFGMLPYKELYEAVIETLEEHKLSNLDNNPQLDEILK